MTKQPLLGVRRPVATRGLRPRRKADISTPWTTLSQRYEFTNDGPVSLRCLGGSPSNNTTAVASVYMRLTAPNSRVCSGRRSAPDMIKSRAIPILNTCVQSTCSLDKLPSPSLRLIPKYSHAERTENTRMSCIVSRYTIDQRVAELSLLSLPRTARNCAFRMGTALYRRCQQLLADQGRSTLQLS